MDELIDALANQPGVDAGPSTDRDYRYVQDTNETARVYVLDVEAIEIGS